MMRTRGLGALTIAVLALAFCLAPAAAQANRALLNESLLEYEGNPKPPQGPVEGACGLAVSASSQLYVSDYYHRAVLDFALSGNYVSQIALPGGSFTGLGINSLDSDCGLAADASGRLYANEWHQAVTRLLPSSQVFDEGHESTGVAVDQASGEVYVDNRTYVAVYESSGAPVEVSGQPLRIGLGSLEDAYGVAVSGGRVYVPDAGSDTIEVFEPAVSASVPVASISHGFTSLVDAAVAIDPTNGHLVVADNTQPGYEHPEAALFEFDSAGAFLGQLACNPVHGQPSGLAFDSGGNLYATNGNGENSNVFKYGMYTAGSVPTPSCAAVSAAGGQALSARAAGGNPVSPGFLDEPTRDARPPAASASSIVQQGGIRVAFDGAISPKRLPRRGAAGASLEIATRFAAADGGDVPQLRRVTIEFNSAGDLHPDSVPSCTVTAIQPSTTAGARAACGRSIVGEGTFAADVRLPRQSPFPAAGKVLAFNGRYKGRPAILAHVFGSKPVPTSFTLPFVIDEEKGTYGTALRAALPEVTGNAAAITGLTLKLGRNFTSHGRRHSFITAGCPAPKGLSSALFPLTRGRFAFAGGVRIAEVVTRSCQARG
jgi:DNA-binding beta-propeller fold protein YncE